jgi:hypothetical protein
VHQEVAVARWDRRQRERGVGLPLLHHGAIHANEIVRLEVDEHGRDVWSFADGVQVVVF